MDSHLVVFSDNVEGRSQIRALSKIFLSFRFVKVIRWGVWERSVKNMYLSEYVLLVISCELTHYEILRACCKAVPVQALDTIRGFQEFKATRISRYSVHEDKVVSATYRPSLLPGNVPGTRFWYRLIRSQGHSAAGRVKSIKIPNYTIGNRTRNIRACSAGPQQTASPHDLTAN